MASCSLNLYLQHSILSVQLYGSSTCMPVLSGLRACKLDCSAAETLHHSDREGADVLVAQPDQIHPPLHNTGCTVVNSLAVESNQN